LPDGRERQPGPTLPPADRLGKGPIEAFGYLAIVPDAFIRKVIGWAMEMHL
jgi:hypothetical protein